MPDTEPPTFICPSTLTTCTDVTVTDNADPSPTVFWRRFGTRLFVSPEMRQETSQCVAAGSLLEV